MPVRCAFPHFSALLDFPMIFGTSNASGAGWIVPAKYYQQVGPDGFKQKPSAGALKLVHQELGTRPSWKPSKTTTGRVHVKQLVMLAGSPVNPRRQCQAWGGRPDSWHLASSFTRRIPS